MLKFYRYFIYHRFKVRIIKKKMSIRNIIEITILFSLLVFISPKEEKPEKQSQADYIKELENNFIIYENCLENKKFPEEVHLNFTVKPVYVISVIDDMVNSFFDFWHDLDLH